MGRKGMTLVELLIVMAVASIIGIFVLNLFITSNRTYIDQTRILDVQRDARLVMHYMVRTLREAGLNPLNVSTSGIPLAGVQEATATKVRIARDTDMDGVLDVDTAEIVSFEYDAARQILRRGYGQAGSERWQDMAKNIIQLSLGYLDVNGNDLGAPGSDPDELVKIRTIQLDVSFHDTKMTGGDFTRSYSTSLTLRN